MISTTINISWPNVKIFKATPQLKGPCKDLTQHWISFSKEDVAIARIFNTIVAYDVREDKAVRREQQLKGNWEHNIGRFFTSICWLNQLDANHEIWPKINI